MFVRICAFYIGLIACGQAATITVSTSAGPGTNLMSTAMIVLNVITPSQAQLSYSISPLGRTCLPSTGSCQGSLNDVTMLGANEAGLAGSYQIGGGTVTGNLNPFCNGAVASSCNITLNPGIYTFSASISDQLTSLTGGMPQPFSEGFSGILTVNTGVVEVVPEPSSVVFVALALAAFFTRLTPPLS